MKRGGIIKALLAILIIVFVGHQIYASTYSSVSTSAAYYYELSDGIDISVTLVRDETLIKNETPGVVHYVLEDGERVAAGGVVAHIYENESASLALTESERLKKQLADLEEILDYNDISAVDIDLSNRKVDAALYSYCGAAANGNYDNLQEKLSELLVNINRRQVATGETSGFDTAILSLKDQIAAQSAKITNPKGNVTSDRSGYFVSSADGYESVLTVSKLQEMTPKEFKEIKPNQVSSQNLIGKVVSDYTVYFATVLPFDQAQKLKTGSKYTLQTQLATAGEISATVEKISEPDEERNVLVVLSCSNINSELATMRSGAMKIITKQYKGLKINSKALRSLNGKTGVYILSGLQAKFVEIEILYTGDTYLICKMQNEDSDRLRLYDEVIEKGSNLYDGKIID